MVRFYLCPEVVTDFGGIFFPVEVRSPTTLPPFKYTIAVQVGGFTVWEGDDLIRNNIHVML